MRVRDTEYKTLDDDADLRIMIDNSSNLQKIFTNCTFERTTTHHFVNCRFESCTFDSLGESTFSNCVFDECKFHFNFHCKMFNCNILKHNGYLIEGSIL